MAKFGQKEEERVNFGESHYYGDLWEALNDAVKRHGEDKLPSSFKAQIAKRDRALLSGPFDREQDNQTYMFSWTNNSGNLTPWPGGWAGLNIQYGQNTQTTTLWERTCDWIWTKPIMPILMTRMVFSEMSVWKQPSLHMFINYVGENARTEVGEDTSNWLKQLECGSCPPNPGPPSNPLGYRGILQLTHGRWPVTYQTGPGFGHGSTINTNVAWFFVEEAEYCEDLGCLGPCVRTFIGTNRDQSLYLKVTPFFTWRPGFGQTMDETFEDLFGGPWGSSFHPTIATHGKHFNRINARIINWT